MCKWQRNKEMNKMLQNAQIVIVSLPHSKRNHLNLHFVFLNSCFESFFCHTTTQAQSYTHTHRPILLLSQSAVTCFGMILPMQPFQKSLANSNKISLKNQFVLTRTYVDSLVSICALIRCFSPFS